MSWIVAVALHSWVLVLSVSDFLLPQDSSARNFEMIVPPLIIDTYRIRNTITLVVNSSPEWGEETTWKGTRAAWYWHGWSFASACPSVWPSICERGPRWLWNLSSGPWPCHPWCCLCLQTAIEDQLCIYRSMSPVEPKQAFWEAYLLTAPLEYSSLLLTQSEDQRGSCLMTEW